MVRDAAAVMLKELLNCDTEPAVAFNWYVPVVLIVRLAKVARPLESVAAVVVPCNVPAPPCAGHRDRHTSGCVAGYIGNSYRHGIDGDSRRSGVGRLSLKDNLRRRCSSIGKAESRAGNVDNRCRDLVGAGNAVGCRRDACLPILICDRGTGRKASLTRLTPVR